MSFVWTTATNLINLGTSPNSGDGDSIRLAFTKINNNFIGLFTATDWISIATTSTAGIVKPGVGLVVSEDGSLSVTGESSTSTVYLLDSNGNLGIDIYAASGAFTLPIVIGNPVTLFSFDIELYSSAMIDIVANDQTEGAIDQGTNYMITWNTDTRVASVLGLSPVSFKSDGTTTTALWDFKDVVLNGNTADVRIANMRGNSAPLHSYAWKAKVTLFRQ